MSRHELSVSPCVLDPVATNLMRPRYVVEMPPVNCKFPVLTMLAATDGGLLADWVV